MKDFHIWEGVYGSFAEAEGAAVGAGFEGDIYSRRVFDATSECLSALANAAPIPRFHKQRSDMLPPVAAMMLQDRERVRILDFGGGLGIGYLVLVESIPRCSERIEYQIVEVPRLCAAGLRMHSGAIRYYSSFPSATEFDLIYSASALQYVESWQETLRTTFSYGSPYVLLSDVFAGNIPTFVTLQNYFDSKIPHWFINIDELAQLATKWGYKVEMETYVSSRRLKSDDILPMENFPQSHRIGETLHLLFARH